jgi:hypothetical protein
MMMMMMMLLQHSLDKLVYYISIQALHHRTKKGKDASVGTYSTLTLFDAACPFLQLGDKTGYGA